MVRAVLSPSRQLRQTRQLMTANDRDIQGAPLLVDVDVLGGEGIVATAVGDGVEVSLDPGLASPSIAKMDFYT